ncbi:sensor histidine kinase [Zunongwangia profunda]|jgi:signal transduction histidine kinase|uniref:sensor histidine kinase n=1 Tax=Zunongwangia profunda TaxID=398743 RepID=UPI001D187847|nr:ATP-binding protein [Zunongwangia profunda]MCC4230706.1 GHKL domain-containing protein [Zunongwangia profunda]
MNRLLSRQIRKYFPEEFAKEKRFQDFFKAVEESYNTNDEQLNMIQRAMKISSDELFSANRKLKIEAQSQKRILDRLRAVISTLDIKNSTSKNKPEEELNVSDLATYIEDQSREVAKAHKEQKELLLHLEKKNQVLSDYAHMVSHDLKSPLRSINSLVTWLKEDYKEKIDEGGINQLDMVLKSVEKMDALISGILNYSTIDQEILDTYDVDTWHLVNEIIQIIYKPSHIKIEISDQLPIIQGDKFRLQQLFQNLIQNAVKSIDKPKGFIKIDVKENDKYWEFSIHDNGKGIDKDHFQKIFQIFEKIDNDFNSTGIGLSIVKKIIDFYGGHIWLESELSKGTIFYFTLPK